MKTNPGGASAGEGVAGRGAVDRAVTYLHVASVDESLRFYALLGFEADSVMRDPTGVAFWALVSSGGGEVMFARASGPIVAEQQAAMMYMYSPDVAALRRVLLEGGVRDAGVYAGRRQAGDGPRAVFEVSHPHHMPEGELRVIDPDGYVILVGQLG
jgi:hypothetical protein